MNYEKLQDIVSIIGEDRVEKVYTVIGGEKVSFATLYKWIMTERIMLEFEIGKGFKAIARDYHISRMTVYRIFRKYIRKHSCPK